MTQQEIAELAMTGATTIVAAMATDAWTTVRGGFSAFIRRRSPDLHAGLEARLDDGAALVARSPDAGTARGVLVGLWQGELERFLAAHPDAAEELEVQTAGMRAALPAVQQQWVQHNTARDHGVVNAVQDGTQHNHYMDSPGTQPPASGA
ncbi:MULTISPECIES: hypothetical protein [unclassified Streptomyces]|uniref:hypothetical protein n=1 Tax=unclassified Streptomyces TaxID=2593676 RepID=UPI002E34325B|nr:hypothetical protein [Streptomyces sp. NBC_01278]